MYFLESNWKRFYYKNIEDKFTMKHNLPGSQKSADYPYQTKKG